MKKIILAALAACTLGVCRPLWAVDIQNASSEAIVPGEWNTNFSNAKTFAVQNGMPLLVLWSNPGCGYCNKMKTACNTDTFVAWRKAKQIVLVISEGDVSVRDWARGSNTQFPFMRLYWPSGNVDVAFTGRSTTIPATGSSLEAQLINYLDSLLKNWSPSGEYIVAGDTSSPSRNWCSIRLGQ